jgi:predicted ATPase
VIASIAFHNFKALRSASVRLERFNLLIGPNGSGKSSLIEGIAVCGVGGGDAVRDARRL